MNALRLGLSRSSRPAVALRGIRAASTIPHTTINSQPSVIPLSNVEAQWEKLSNEDKVATALQLEELQKKDWKELSLQEKKASTCSVVWSLKFASQLFPLPYSLLRCFRTSWTSDAL